LTGPITHIGSERTAKPEQATKKEPVPVIVSVEESDLSRARVEPPPYADQITVSSTTRRPQATVPETKTKPAPPPKLLKVIRRRGEQPPKVFETVTRTFPKAMLEGIKISREEDTENR
jgi:hypothetical protein